MLRKAIWNLSLERNICPAFLEFIGTMEFSNKVLFLFNVLDDQNIQYRSTIAFKAESAIPTK